MGGSKGLLSHFSFGQAASDNPKADFHLTLIQDSALFFSPLWFGSSNKGGNILIHKSKMFHPSKKEQRSFFLGKILILTNGLLMLS